MAGVFDLLMYTYMPWSISGSSLSSEAMLIGKILFSEI